MASHAIIVTKQAHRDVNEARKSKDLSMPAWPLRLLLGALRYFAGRGNRFDIEGVPDSMKRDLGFLDGCEPYREEERMH
ncbi:hypothetical protein PY650_24650 [Rhizobium calliandrae]|uniref:Uncharacterized protein n=1 Tax=Rhizobium calliandrae TaxID=1312182 RepID=A0ABT7KJG0_9HYPH|nr:hypothetical protein [Rhizobium calliandrae]MDL2408774.1 hypothetical protein [Rhizobium calliandrae]